MVGPSLHHLGTPPEKRRPVVRTPVGVDDSVGELMLYQVDPQPERLVEDGPGVRSGAVQRENVAGLPQGPDPDSLHRPQDVDELLCCQRPDITTADPSRQVARYSTLRAREVRVSALTSASLQPTGCHLVERCNDVGEGGPVDDPAGQHRV